MGASRVCAVSPCVDLASYSNGSGLARNFLYEWNFLRGLRNTLEKKAKLFLELYRVQAVERVRTLRGWREAVTAPAGGYRNAAAYYPEATFHHPAIVGNRSITLMAPIPGFFPSSWCSKLPREMFCALHKTEFTQGSTTRSDL